MTPKDLKQISDLLDKKLDIKFQKHEVRIVEKTVKLTVESTVKLIKEAIEESEVHIIELVDKHKADKVDLKIIEERVEKLENTVFS